MKGIKHVLSFGVGVGYTSAWWAYMTSTSKVNLGLELILTITTFLLVGFCGIWLATNWE